MGRRYETGSKDSVLRYMALCAIRDREAFISAWASVRTLTATDKRLIEETRAEIRDFKKLAGLG